MRNFDDFIKEALKGNGVYNDDRDVWVKVVENTTSLITQSWRSRD